MVWSESSCVPLAPRMVSRMRRPADCGPPPAQRWLVLRLDAVHRLVDDDFTIGHLRRILKDVLELLVANPLGCDTSRLVGLRRSLEEADRAHDAVAGVDEEVAAEAGKLAQLRCQALADLLGQLVDVARVDAFVTSDSRKHSCS